MRAALLSAPVRRWHCPKCRLSDTTREARPHSRMHNCSRLRGMTVPMLPEDVGGKVELHEPEDYVGNRHVQRGEDGRPVMSVTTEREDGLDTAVYVPLAVATREEL